MEEILQALGAKILSISILIKIMYKPLFQICMKKDVDIHSNLLKNVLIVNKSLMKAYLEDIRKVL